MISYKLVQDSNDCDKFFERILKYKHRGFDLLVPITFNDDKLYQSITTDKNNNDCNIHNDCQDDGLSHYCSFMLNNDTNRIRQQFIDIIKHHLN